MSTIALPEPRSRLVEFFTLRLSRALSAIGPDASRIGRTQSLGLIAQRRSAAEVLWSAGQPAEALRLLVEAARLANQTFDDTWQSLSGGEELDLESRLHRIGASRREARSATNILERLDALRLPVLDDEVVSGDSNAYASILDAVVLLERLVRGTTLSNTAARTRLAVRWFIAFSVFVAGVAGAIVGLRKPMMTASASASFDGSARYAADRVLDGDPSTSWCLPDAAPGFVDLRLREPRTITNVIVTNSHNPPAEDRATKEFRIELFDGDRKIATKDARFPIFSSNPQPMRVAVAGSHVTRVRVQVLSHHKTGACLAEVGLE